MGPKSRSPLEEPIRNWLAKPIDLGRSFPGSKPQPVLDVSVGEVLESALKIEPCRWTQTDQNRVVRCLNRLGFTKYRSRSDDGSRAHRYRRDDQEEPF